MARVSSSFSVQQQCNDDRSSSLYDVTANLTDAVSIAPAIKKKKHAGSSDFFDTALLAVVTKHKLDMIDTKRTRNRCHLTSLEVHLVMTAIYTTSYGQNHLSRCR